MPSWSSRTRRGRAVVPLHWVHAAKLRLSTSVPCVLCRRPISAHGLSCWIAWAQQLDFGDRWQDYAETRSEAAALWHELGDFARESDSLLALAWGLWRLCRGADFGRTADAALRLAKPLGPSPQLANAYITLAYRHMIKGRYQDGLALLQHAREMSEQLGLGDVISDSLNVEARIVRAMGNDWTVPMRAALEIALSGGHELRAGDAFANMYWMYCDELRHEEAEQIYHEALAYCDVARHRHLR